MRVCSDNDNNSNLSYLTIGGANKICDLDLMKYTKIIEKMNVIVPMAMVMFSWACDGLKKTLTLISCQLDSVHELYKPDDQS